MIITIDGPAGSGKSTIARKLAARLGIAYLDTGAMYRAIALKALRAGIDLADARAVLAVALGARIEVDCGPTHTRVMLDGDDISEAIRGMEVNQATRFVARVQPVRELLVARQREIGRRLGSLVTEGRDQGSVVFPDADLRVVMDAALERRAKRRHVEMLAEGEEVRFHDILENLRERDDNDAHQWSGLLDDPRVLYIDTTHLGINEVVQALYDEVTRRCGSADQARAT